MVRTVLLAVNDANLTGNYTVLRDICAPESQSLNSPERLAASFENMRQQGFDFSVVGIATAKFSQMPAMTPQGYLRVSGEFDSSPRVTFDIFYQHVVNRWRPYAIGVGLVPVEAAPPPVVKAPPKPQSQSKKPRGKPK